MDTIFEQPILTGTSRPPARHSPPVVGAPPVATGTSDLNGSNVALVADANALLTRTMNRICSWCQAPLGVVACLPEQDGGKTHGVCSECCARQLEPGLVKQIEQGDSVEVLSVSLFRVHEVRNEDAQLGLRMIIHKRFEQLNHG